MQARVRLACACLLAMVLGAACSGPTTPTSQPPPSLPPIPDVPTITCPASIAARSPDGEPLRVTYDATTVGGEPPVTIACTMDSGSIFPVGTTTVTCSATDSLKVKGPPERSDSCSFEVTVALPHRVSATRFVAFGDSITEGKLSFGPLMLVTSPSWSYPFKLQTLLSRRYTAQTMVVLDEGIGGERVAAGMDRLPGVLSADAPQVVLLMEGVNDLNADGAEGIPIVVDALRSMIRTARGRGVQVFIATLLPQRVGGSRAYTPELIQPVNDRIRAMVAGESAVLVDLYQAFVGQEGVLLGADGLHPNEAGYQRIAETFFDAIRSRLETAQDLHGATPIGSPTPAP